MYYTESDDDMDADQPITIVRTPETFQKDVLLSHLLMLSLMSEFSLAPGINIGAFLTSDRAFGIFIFITSQNRTELPRLWTFKPNIELRHLHDLNHERKMAAIRLGRFCKKLLGHGPERAQLEQQENAVPVMAFTEIARALNRISSNHIGGTNHLTTRSLPGESVAKIRVLNCKIINNKKTTFGNVGDLTFTRGILTDEETLLEIKDFAPFKTFIDEIVELVELLKFAHEYPNSGEPPDPWIFINMCKNYFKNSSPITFALSIINNWFEFPWIQNQNILRRVLMSSTSEITEYSNIENDLIKIAFYQHAGIPLDF